MSTGQECWYLEDKPGEWYVIVESNWANRYDSFPDDESDCFGPFATSEQGSEFLHQHFANPGGAWVIAHDSPMHPRTNETVVKLITKAAERKKQIERSSLGGGFWIIR